MNVTKKITNKHEIAKKLDNLAKSVAQRGVFVVSKEENYYVILDAYIKKPVLTYIPTKSSAQRICERLNRLKTPRNNNAVLNIKLAKVQKAINHNMDLYNEGLFYKAILKSPKTDTFKKEVMNVRLSETILKLKLSIDELSNII